MVSRSSESPKRPSSGQASGQVIDPELIEVIRRRLSENHRVRRNLPERGRLHIDRQLPFLSVYRRPSDRDDAGTERLVKGEASYLVAPGSRSLHKSLSTLVREVATTLSAEFGAFLILEIWAGPDGGQANDAAVPSVPPRFTVHAASSGAPGSAVEALAKRLRRIKILKQGVEVEVLRDGHSHPPGMRPLLTTAARDAINCSIVGIVVPPVYRSPDSGAEFPMLSRSLRRSLGLAVRQGCFEFARARTTHRPPHYHALGRKAVVQAVWDVDRRLASVSNQFDYLLQLTPVNTTDAWKQFRAARFEHAPEFHYRPLPVDPSALKRDLFKIPIERVEDPALQRLFQEKQDELELKLTMLRDRDTRRFRYESLQLFGGVSDELLQLATSLLERLAIKGRRERGDRLDAARFAERATAEIELYRRQCDDFKASAQVARDVSGMIVSRGKLLINADLSLPPSRVKALLAHEVGTHLVTYYNGRMQPFQQLYAGLAGYEELQEGLAVLSEYLVGSLGRTRMRQLAARVVAVRRMTEGASFVETFRELDREHQFNQRSAYNTTMRVYRGGGLTKDAIYLRGLEAILKYVQKGGDLRTLLVGKMAVEHIPIIKELQYRNVLRPVPIVPTYMLDPEAIDRLERLRDGNQSIVDLVSDSSE